MFKGVGAERVNACFTDVLAPLRELGIRPVLAGGFLRDAVMGVQYGDIDLFVHAGCSGPTELDEWELTLDHFGVDCRPVIDMHDRWDAGPAEAEYKQSNIVAQMSFPSKLTGVLDGATINLIGWGAYQNVTPRSVADQINLGFCQIASDGTEMTWTKHFLRDMAEQQFTLVRRNWGLEGTMKHWMKLQSKYPWPLRYLSPKDELDAILEG